VIKIADAMLAREELSGILHGLKPTAQFHRCVRDRFQPATETVCRAKLCLKDGNPHRDSSRIMGKIVHLSLLRLFFVSPKWDLQSIATLQHHLNPQI